MEKVQHKCLDVLRGRGNETVNDARVVIQNYKALASTVELGTRLEGKSHFTQNMEVSSPEILPSYAEPVVAGYFRRHTIDERTHALSIEIDDDQIGLTAGRRE